jgi:HYDIN/CFA65/VesB-like, Ig-like domain
MRKFFTSGRRRYALLLFVVGAGSLALMGAQCQPTKPPAPTGLSVAPTSQDFGSQAIGAGPTTAEQFTVTNNGPDTSGTLAVTLDSFNPADFVIVAADDNCTGTTVASGDTCTVDVTFDPATAGPKQASLDVASDEPADGTATATLTGIGTP